MIRPVLDILREVNLSKLPPSYNKILSLYDLDETYRHNFDFIMSTVLFWSTWEKQGRVDMNIDSKLMVAAQIRALVIHHTGEKVEDWDGFTAHDLVRSVGYELPDYPLYTKKENSVQTISGFEEGTVPLLLDIMLESGFNHVSGTGNFYRTQTEIGVGCIQTPDQTICIFMSAHKGDWVVEEGFDPQI